MGWQYFSVLQIREHPFQINTIAESLNLSSRTLQRNLAEQGLKYLQLLTDVRIRQAACLLESTDMPISEIAYELGYAEASNFTRAFRRRIGVAPGAFRDNAEKALISSSSSSLPQ